MSSRQRALLAGAALTVGALTAGCGSGSGGDAGDNPTVGTNPPGAGASASASTGATTAAGPCTATTAPSHAPKQFPSEPPLTVQPTTYTAVLTTNCGTITLTLDAKKAPHTVNSFAFLAGKHYFDDSPCHRLTTAQSGISVLQCGDPSGSGTGTPGYTIPDENLEGARYPAGTVAMANTGQAHTGGSQFFLVYADTQLPAQYTPFGTISGGLDVLKAIAAAGEDDANGPGDGHPTTPVVLQHVTVRQGA